MKALCVAALLSLSTTALAQEGWLTVRDTDLRIEAGSALDFSSLLDSPDSLRERVGVNEAGRFALNGGKGERRRFLCAPIVFSGPNGGFPDHAGADELARQLRMHGYSLTRFPLVDAALMKGRNKDFDYDPEQLDRFHYLLAALKKQGIRWMIDAATSWNGAYGDVKGGGRFARDRKLKISVHYDAESQAHWKKMVDTILNVRNKYTGSTILQDPALTTVTLFNELGINYGSNKGYPPELQQKFREWARKRGEQGDDVPDRRDVSARAALMQAFVGETERATSKWMSDYLHGLGYSGLVTAYNNGKSIQAAAARGAVDVVSLHAYHDIPEENARPGSELEGESAVANALPYVQHFGVNRYLHRPFVIDEYSHPYWNPWRREAIAVPAYAALQDWDAICRYNNPVKLAYDDKGPRRSRALGPFTVALDPVARATETLAALLFARGDVSTSKQRVPVKVDNDFLYGPASATNAMPESLGRLVLLTGVGLVEEGKGGAGIKADAAESQRKKPWVGGAMGKSPEGWQKNLRQLKSAGLLPANSDESGAAYQSDTGELLLEPGQYRLNIRTPRTEAFTFGKELPAPGAVLKVEKSDVPAMVSLSSLDGKNLNESRRMLLIVATDAQNTGDKFSGDRRTLEKLGELPVLIQPISLQLLVKSSAAAELKAYALSLTGKRNEPVAVEVVEGGLRINIDTAKLAKGPTTYFELTR